MASWGIVINDKRDALLYWGSFKFDIKNIRIINGWMRGRGIIINGFVVIEFVWYMNWQKLYLIIKYMENESEAQSSTVKGKGFYYFSWCFGW